MLYHVTATHAAENCPGYNEDVQVKMREFTETTLPKLSAQLKIKVHFVVTPAPEHVIYMLLETDDFSAITKLLMAVPLKQDFSVKQVSEVVQVAQLSF